MITAMPGERTINLHVPGGWSMDDDAQALATLKSAIQHGCRWTVPLMAWQPGTHLCAVALDTGVPAVLEASVLLGIGLSDLSLRVPESAEEDGRRCLRRIREQALTRTRQATYPRGSRR